MNKIKSIKKMVLFTLLTFFLVGCSSNEISENTKLKNENNQLKQQLDIANEKIKTQSELYDLRNILDYKTHMILLELSNGNTDYLKDKVTNNVTVSGNKILSNSGPEGTKIQFEIPKELFNLRQRAYTLSDDKKEFSSIYEILPIEESNIMKTLHVYFILDNGQWKLDLIMRDE